MSLRRLGDVLGALHEGQGDPVGAEIEAEASGRSDPSRSAATSGSTDVGHVHALAVGELAADLDLAFGGSPSRLFVTRRRSLPSSSSSV